MQKPICQKLQQQCNIIQATSRRTPQAFTNAANSAKFLQLPQSRCVKNSFIKSPDLHCGLDLHQNPIANKASHTSHLCIKFCQNPLTIFGIIANRQTDKGKNITSLAGVINKSLHRNGVAWWKNADGKKNCN